MTSESSLIEAEACLIGKMMTDNRFIDRVVDKLTADDFVEPLLGRLFAVITQEHALGRSPNPITLRPLVEHDVGLQDLGGIAFLARLTGNIAINMVDPAVADHIARQARRRRMIAELENALTMAKGETASLEEVVDIADAALAEATTASGNVVHLAAAECIDHALARLDSPVKGVTSTTIKQADDLVGALRPKELTILAGRPGMGKTAFATSYALGAAQGGHGVLFVSLEMSTEALGARMAADLCFDGSRGVPFAGIRNGDLGRDQIRRVREARDMLASLPFQVVDAASITLSRLNMIVRRHKRRMAARGQSLDLVIVDYLQLVNANSRSANRYEAVSEVSRGMKALAKEHDVTVLALAQLSRSVEQREDKRPQLADLKESGQIEQDADNVLFLLRDEYYVRKAEPDPASEKHPAWQMTLENCHGMIEFICAKARNGVEGSALGRFHGAYQAVRGAA